MDDLTRADPHSWVSWILRWGIDEQTDELGTRAYRILD
jgi:hypothetical protein